MKTSFLKSHVLMLATAASLLAPANGTAQQGGQMPPPLVSVLSIQARPVPVMSELPGRVAATRVSEVRARVSGILQERVFEQGAHVNQGDVLYRIDPRLFKVRVASAEASLQRAKATQSNAKQQFDRQKTLRDRNVASGIDFDNASVALAQADADVALAQAALEEARINLEYTEVRAPISGVIGAALVTEGALVAADGTQNLALIQQIDPIYADFTQSASDMMALRRATAEGKLQSPEPGAARVQLIFDDGTPYKEAGKLLFSNASVEASTGQVTLRAEFSNASDELLPGMYVRVRIEQAIRPNAITVPQRAVLRTAEGRAQVYVISADQTAQVKDVTLGQAINAEWVVESGLKPGDNVVVDGVQKVQPGAPVSAEPWNPTGSAENNTNAAPAQKAD